ncbi:hypothetical protein [Lonepinella sp. BR2357]|uniref:hypothetical protein n=1 Tax=Lonepinella sp. BR2357 TaxID=3434549 RepID=UPI003F6E3FD5
MNKKCVIVSLGLLLCGCSSLSSMYLPQQTAESDAAIAQRRAEIRAMEQQDYKDTRQKRKDSIQDLGEMQMNEAKAINKAYENRSKQSIQILY